MNKTLMEIDPEYKKMIEDMQIEQILRYAEFLDSAFRNPVFGTIENFKNNHISFIDLKTIDEKIAKEKLGNTDINEILNFEKEILRKDLASIIKRLKAKVKPYFKP